MYEVVGIVLDSSTQVYYFSPNDILLKAENEVIVETENGYQYGKVKTKIMKKHKKDLVLPLKNVVRLVNEEDKQINHKNSVDAKEALKYSKKIIKELSLKMNMVEANYTFDRKQLFFTFLADTRIDFRELAKKLAQKFKTRIELRQIGVRDKAKRYGGIGPCGLKLCCNTFLTEFVSVSISMAKNQFLALNPSKINGVCGRLLCCLNYEDETYAYLKQDIPKIGSFVTTKEGKGKVISINILKQTYRVELQNRNIIEVAK